MADTTPPKPVATIPVGEHTLHVYVLTDADDTPFVQLGSPDADLEGDEPGVYYLVTRTA